MGLEQSDSSNKGILSTIMSIFHYAWVGVNVILLNPFKGISFKKDNTVKEVNAAIAKAHVIKEDTFFEKMYKKDIYFICLFIFIFIGYFGLYLIVRIWL